MRSALTVDLSFGESVVKESQKLADSGKDANQIANILCQKDPKGQNYGIGIVLGGNGKPLPTSPTLLKYSKDEISLSSTGTYMNSAKLIEKLTQAVLRWQRIPEKYWPQFQLGLPSDAGTGAVQTAVQVVTALHPQLTTLGVEELGWPAYKPIAQSARLQFKEYASSAVIDENNVLPIYQSGPMNTTGQVPGADVMVKRAKAAGQAGGHLILDRAYSGFEFARLLDSEGYNKIMKKSFDLQIAPFIEEGVGFSLALSPTKAFVTFALRPCGFLLVFVPEKKKAQEISLALNSAVRARGSSFEHPVTRAFAKAFTQDLAALEKEHEGALKRLAESEKLWRKLSKGTAIEFLFSEQYAGLFRNPQAKPEAPASIYNQHIYPVFSAGRCRLNATGIPTNESLARSHVQEFAKFCF